MGRNRVHSAKPLDSNPISKGLFEGGHACLFVSREIIRMDTSSDKTFSIFFLKEMECRWADCFDIGLSSLKKLNTKCTPRVLFFFCRSLDDVFGWSDFHKH